MGAIISAILTVILVVVFGKTILFVMIGLGAVYLYNNGEWWGPILAIIVFFFAVQMWWFVSND